MKKFTVVWSVLIIILAMSLVSAQTVNVTFRANTSKVHGIVDSTGGVDLRGGMQDPGWIALADPLTSDGGDYWSITWQFDAAAIGTTIEYKFGGSIKDALTGLVNDWWENDLPGADFPAGVNRSIVVPAQDSVLDIQYVGSLTPPFTDDPDSIDVYFRLDMSSNFAYNPDTDIMHLAGTPNGWTHEPMTKEGMSSFWNTHYKIAADGAQGSATWKFSFGAWDGTEESDDRTVSPIVQDTTLQFKYYNDEVPVGAPGEDSVLVKFKADLSRAITENGFTPGDTLLVKYGFDGTSTFKVDTLTREGFIGNVYSVTDTVFRVESGGILQYEYNVIFNGSDEREIFFDFQSTATTEEAEKRKLDVSKVFPDTIFVDDVEESKVLMRRQPRFRNLSELPKDVTVYYECDLRPPYYHLAAGGDTLKDIQGDFHVTIGEIDSIFSWGVWMTGLAVGGWENPGGDNWGLDLRNNPLKTMYDDGATGGDETAGDSVYTLTWFYSGPDSNDTYGQVFKFGIYGGDNEGGKGGFGNNHVENIPLVNPGTQDPETVTIFSQFGSINPAYYGAWDYDAVGPATGIVDEATGIIKSPQLKRNYPNPFNPVTTITFQLPKAQDVKLVIYDALGREVYKIFDGKRRKGLHVVNWNGIDRKGKPVSSGIYFYRLVTENYDKTMKMVLLK